MTDRPRIGISACLLGQRVRYDGRDKRDAWLVEVLGPDVDWVPVCPEVEAGFGTPREPMELVRDSSSGVVLMTTRLRSDLTAVLRAASERRVEELAGARLDGYVLKAGSPSCGLDIAIRHETMNAKPANAAETDSGHGLFAEALMRRLPDLPVVDERQLRDPGVRRRFVDRVFAHHRETGPPR